MTIVLALPAGTEISKNISKELSLEHHIITHKLFPDGESYLRLPRNIKGQTVLLVQTTFPNQDKRLMELILAADACKEYGANEVIALIPYMAYSRQDKAFLEGEVVSIRAVLKSLRSAGIETLITVDIHKEESLRYFDGKAINVEPWQVFANVLGSDVKEDALVIAPDKGAEKRAATLAREIGVNYVVFSKYRDRITGEIRHEYKDIKLEGKHVIIVDDIISTGGTVADIAKFVSERGAKKVYAVASHGLFVRNAVRRLRESRVDEVYVLNTVPQKENVKVLDVSPAVVNVLKELI